MSKEDFILELYKISAERRHYYNAVSWAVGALLVPISLYILWLELTSGLPKVASIYGVFLLLFWHIAYDNLERNAEREEDTLARAKEQILEKKDFNSEVAAKMALGFRRFDGFASLISFWSLRWLFFSLYLFIMAASWHDHLQYGLYEFLFPPLIIIFLLNSLDNKFIEFLRSRNFQERRSWLSVFECKSSFKLTLRNIVLFFMSKVRFVMIVFTLLWTYYGFSFV